MWIVFAVLYALVSMLTGWLFMLAVGVVHHEWLHSLPTLGFWWAVLIAALLRAAFGSLEWGSRSG